MIQLRAEKNYTIETLRGFAIILVVLGHVIGSAPDGGMKIDFPSPFRYLYLWIDYIQMPLFTAIAGWVYALKPIDDKPLGLFIWGKFKRLIVPMLFVATSYYLIQYVTPGTNNKSEISDIWRIFVFPYTLFWYLQSLFLIFVAIAIVDKLLKRITLTRWFWILAISYALYIAQIAIIPDSIPNVFSFKGALEQLPAFVVGIGIQRFGGQFNKAKVGLYALGVVGIILLQVRWFCPEIDITTYKVIIPLWTSATLILLMTSTIRSRFLVYIGAYAYTIYLLHGFGTAGGRIILSKLGISNQIVVFIIASLVALFLPILVDVLLSKSRILRRLFLGKR